MAVNLLAAPAAFYSGQLADSRALQILVPLDDKNHAAWVQVEGNPYSVTLDRKTNSALRIEFNCGPYSEAERWSITGLRLTPAGLPATANGHLTIGKVAGGVAFTATNVASLEQFSRKRGGRFAGRGGGKVFSATWPSFHDGMVLHELLSKRLAAEAKGEIGSFTAGAYGIMWEGLLDGGASWDWEGSLGVRIVWLTTNLVSLLEMRYEYTGGAHGASDLVGRNFVFDGGKAREFRLPELFRTGVSWANALSAPCLRELRRQKAS